MPKNGRLQSPTCHLVDGGMDAQRNWVIGPGPHRHEDQNQPTLPEHRVLPAHWTTRSFFYTSSCRGHAWWPPMEPGQASGTVPTAAHTPRVSHGSRAGPSGQRTPRQAAEPTSAPHGWQPATLWDPECQPRRCERKCGRARERTEREKDGKKSTPAHGGQKIPETLRKQRSEAFQNLGSPF